MAKNGAKQAEEVVTEMTSVKKLTALLRVARAAYKDVRSIVGGKGEQISRMVEHDHLHKKAWSTVEYEDRMEPEKYAAFRDNQDYYRDVLGLDEKRASAPRLPMAEEGEDENVHRFPNAAE